MDWRWAQVQPGWSHIGVINTLNQMGIDVDIVAGCSIGSLVGSAYACGKLPQLESWVRSFSYWDVLRLMDLSWQRGGPAARRTRIQSVS